MTTEVSASRAHSALSSPNFEAVDRPLKAHIFEFLPIADEVKLRQVSRDFQSVVDEFRTPLDQSNVALSSINARFSLPRVVSCLSSTSAFPLKLPRHLDRLFFKACERNMVAFADQLLNQRDESGNPMNRQRALYTTASTGCEGMFERLFVSEMVDPTREDHRVFRIAAQQGHAPLVDRMLVDDRIDPGAREQYAIRWAATEGREAVVESLLADDRVNPTINECEPLRRAAQGGHAVVVKHLLNDGRSDPAMRNNEALRMAARDGHINVVRALVHDGCVDPSVNVNEPLKAAVANGDWDMARLFMSDKRVIAKLALVTVPFAVTAASILAPVYLLSEAMSHSDPNK